MEFFNNPIEAKKYIEMRFEYESELKSYFQEFTDNGVFTKKDLIKFDNETLINVANDLRYQFKCEFGV